jgi:uncharacterized repeat protein (TIGR02543 family)
MLHEASFAGFDFVATWKIDEGESTPYFRKGDQLVEFDPNGGKCDTASAAYAIGGVYADLPVATRTKGHAFLGWFDAPEGGNRVDENSTVPDIHARMLYAHWTREQVTVFLGNGGTPERQTTTNTIYAEYGELPEAAWDGHVFLGWFNAPEGGKRVWPNSNVTLAGTRTLYAQWSENQVVTFKGNGGQTPTPRTQDYPVGEPYGELPTAKWSRHGFVGWFTEPEGGTQVVAADLVESPIARTLYAHWSTNQVTLFDGNGGSPRVQYTTNAIYAKYGTLPTASRKGGYLFAGWYNAPEGGKRVWPNSTVTCAATRTLYAHWSNRQVTTFMGNGGTPDVQTTTNTIYAKYGTLPTATREGHRFAGWFNAPEDGKRVYATSTVTLAAKRTLYAHWEDGASATGLAISGFSMEPGAPSTVRGNRGRTAGILSFEAQAGRIYELQWAPALGAEWTTLRRWPAATDGPSSVEVPATPGESSGFYRLARPVAGVE